MKTLKKFKKSLKKWAEKTLYVFTICSMIFFQPGGIAVAIALDNDIASEIEVSASSDDSSDDEEEKSEEAEEKEETPEASAPEAEVSEEENKSAEAEAEVEEESSEEVPAELNNEESQPSEESLEPANSENEGEIIPEAVSVEVVAEEIEEAGIEGQITEEAVSDEKTAPVEEAKASQEAVEPEEDLSGKECMDDDDEIKDSEKDDWNIDGDTAETKDDVELGVKYVFPLNDKVSVTFSCLPKDPEKRASLKIEQVKTVDLDLPEGISPASEYAYDITTEMDNGDFEYDVTLPKAGDSNAEVSYIEKTIDEAKDEVKKDEVKKIDEDKIEKNNEIIEVSELDHFTIYLVTWNFPDNLDNAIADGGTTANLVKTITAVGTNAPTYATNGDTSKSARATGWDAGSGVKYWQIEFDSQNFEDLILSSKQRSSSTGPKDFKVQYSTDGLAWADVSGGSITVADNWTSGVVSNIALPSDLNDQPSAYIRWIMTSDIAVVGGGAVGSTGANQIDDIIIKGIRSNMIEAVDEVMCNNDSDGVNEKSVPGQKDLTRFCRNIKTNDPLQITWNWDEISMPGGNSGDACALFDVDHIGDVGYDLADYAVCVSWEGEGEMVAGYPQLYSCGDSNADRCTSPNPIPMTTGLSYCDLSLSDEDPFPTGDDSPFDMQAYCEIDPADSGGEGASDFIDVCSFPSGQPNSAPSDCIAMSMRRGNLQVNKNVVPDDTSTNWEITVTGPSPFSDILTGDDSTDTRVVDSGTYNISESAGDNTNLANYNSTYSCLDNGTEFLSGTGTSISEISINSGDFIQCTFTNTLKTKTLTVVKDLIPSTDGGKFIMNANGITGVEGGDGAQASASVIIGDTVTFGESAVAGTDLTDYTSTYSCEGDSGFVYSGSGANGSFVMPSEDVNCTITNYIDYLPTVALDKSVDKKSIAEPGGDFTYTLDITNNSVENVTITALTDDNTLSTQCTDLIGDVLIPGQKVSCSYVINHTEAGIYPNTASVTVQDNEENTDDATDSESVEVTNTNPTVALDKSVDKKSIAEPGGDFTYTLDITNNSVENVTITALTDDNTLSTQCTDLIGDVLIPGQKVSCSYVINHTEAGIYPNTASVTVQDNEENTDDATDSESVEVTNTNPTVALDKSVDKKSIAEPGGDFTYTLDITNNSVENVTITALTDDNTLSTQCTDLIGDVLIPGQKVSCSYVINHTEAGIYPNTASVTVQDNEENTDDATDSESVEVTNTNPTVALDKSVDKKSIAEPGGDFTYTLDITNNSVENVTITALTDDNTLSTQCTDLIGDVLIPGQKVSCSYVINHTEAGIYPNTASVTVQDNEENTDDATDSESVEVTNTNPTVALDKSVDKKSIAEPGGDFTYTLDITNNSVENVTITALTDDNTLSTQCTDLIGDVLIPGQKVSCSYVINHTEAGIYPNTASVTVQDNEENTDDATDSESVTVVGAYITISPLEAINSINDPHTFIVTVMKNDGSEFVPASGEHVDFVLTDNLDLGAASTLDTILSTCDDAGANTDNNGQCVIVINSSNPGTITAHASVDLTVGGNNLHRETDGILGSSVDAVKTYVAGKIIVIKQTNPDQSDLAQENRQLFEFDPSWSETNFNLTAGQQNDSGWLAPGNYSIAEVNIPNGWESSIDCVGDSRGDQITDFSLNAFVLEDISTIDPNNIVLDPNEIITCTVTNTFIPPILQIEKENNTEGNDKQPGGSVTYTLTITAPGGEEGNMSNVKDVVVTDLPPVGFKYRDGSWVAKSNFETDNDPNTNHIGELKLKHVYASPGEWSLGDMQPGEVVELAYVADIDDDQDSGDYRDLAYATGRSLLGDTVYANDTDPDTDPYFSNTEVKVVRSATASVEVPEETKTETETKHKTKKVLGAAIYLPATGSNTLWIIAIIIMLIFGAVLIVLGKRRDKLNSSIKNGMKVIVIMFALSALAISGGNAMAGTADPKIAVQIEKPNSPNTNEFKIGFTTLDMDNSNLEVKCFKVNAPDFEFPASNVEYSQKDGGNSGNCVVDETITPTNGEYKFYVEAWDGATRFNRSETVSVEIITGTPGTPTNYDRDGDSCTVDFKTADDGGKTYKVVMYRSKEHNFIADSSIDSSTYATEIQAGSNESESMTDPKGNCDDYFYVIRAFNEAGVGSGFVGDEDVNIKHKTETETDTETIYPIVYTSGAIPVSEEEGTVAGEETQEGVAGESTEQGQVAGEGAEGEKSVAGSWASKVFQKWPWILLAIIILAGIYYAFRRKKSSKQSNIEKE